MVTANGDAARTVGANLGERLAGHGNERELPPILIAWISVEAVLRPS